MTWILTRNGVRFDILNYNQEDFLIEDVASALSKICRFNGHCSGTYSVAEHSIYVLDLVSQHTSSPRTRLLALLHDASEAYIVDFPRPYKSVFPEVVAKEKEIQTAIYRKFIPDFEEHDLHHPLIKSADNKMVIHEMFTLMPPDPVYAKEAKNIRVEYKFERLPSLNNLMTAEDARINFITNFNEIRKELGYE